MPFTLKVKITDLSLLINTFSRKRTSIYVKETSVEGGGAVMVLFLSFIAQTLGHKPIKLYIILISRSQRSAWGIISG